MNLPFDHRGQIDFPRILLSLRARRLPPSKLAYLLGVQPSTVSKWSCGHYPMPQKYRSSVLAIYQAQRHV
jgi:hypothetical protein